MFSALSSGRVICHQCGGSTHTLKTARRAHRWRYTYLHLSLRLLTCTRCGTATLGADDIAELKREYARQLRQRAAMAAAALAGAVSRGRLELLLGLSQGYLSKLARGTQPTSASLCSLLSLIAAEPDARLQELRHAPRSDCTAALLTLKEHRSRRRLEALLDLSPGYLSKVAHDDGAHPPSKPLVILLGLLASQPQRLLELERYWLMTVIK